MGSGQATGPRVQGRVIEWTEPGLECRRQLCLFSWLQLDHRDRKTLVRNLYGKCWLGKKKSKNLISISIMVFMASLLGPNWWVAALPSPAPRSCWPCIQPAECGAALPSTLQANGGWCICSISAGLAQGLIRQTDSAWSMFKKRLLFCVFIPLSHL